MTFRPLEDSAMKPSSGFEIGYAIVHEPRFSMGCRVRRIGEDRLFRRIFDSYEAACRATYAAGHLAIVHEPGGLLETCS